MSVGPLSDLLVSKNCLTHLPDKSYPMEMGTKSSYMCTLDMFVLPQNRDSSHFQRELLRRIPDVISTTKCYISGILVLLKGN